MLLIALNNVAPQSLKNYECRLRKLLSFTNKSLNHVLSHPREIYATLLTDPKTLLNYLTLIAKIFASNPHFATKYPKSQQRWLTLLSTHKSCRKESQ